MNELVLENENILPKGWSIASFNDVSEKVTVGYVSKITDQYVSKGIPFFRSKNVRENFLDIQGINYISKEFHNKISKSKLEPNDILVVRSGSVGTACIIPDFIKEANCSDLSIIKKPRGIIPSYGAHYINSIGRFFVLKNQVGIGLPHFNTMALGKMQIPVPPLNEQKRIMKKVEERFSELDNAKTILEKNKLQLKQYRESLLKSTFEGKLTKKWREANKTNLDIVLKEIELGRKSQDKKLENIEPDKNSDFFMIPNEWKWIKVGIISKEIQYGTSEKATTTKSKIPVLRMGNIQDGELNFDNLKYYPENWKNFKQFLLEEGDVLFNRTNSAELVGKTAVYRNNHPTAVFAGYLIRVKTIEGTYIPYLLSCYVNSIFGKSYIKSVVTQQVGQANVNATKLSMMPIPLMSFEEQKEIISQLELGFSLIKNTENISNSMLSQLDTLRSSILKLAFEGKLVPQDPNDEPAEILLQKIKQEKEQLKQKEKSKKRKKNGR